MKILGIPVKIHWSFYLLLAFFGVQGSEHGLGGIALMMAIIAVVFGCVVVHEFGHALMARKFGIGTRDITLYPLGGVASLDYIPKDGWQELWISVAGPLTNLVMAAGGFLAGTFIPEVEKYAFAFTYINVMMLAFNLLPAFPMDGGRILRSVMHLITGDYKFSTLLATTVAKFMAVGMFVFGFWQAYWTMPFIAMLVFVAAHAEGLRVEGKLPHAEEV
jgi:Zn-dependent protease